MILSIIVFIFSLLGLVIIHELGHFLVAKKFGIKVLEFGFGIPPKIWGKKFGETLYSINALPLGGFVRLFGEDQPAKDLKFIKGGDKSRNFSFKPVSQRILVVIAGVVMNLVLAWIIFYAVIISQGFKIIYPNPEPGVYIGYIQENFPAQKAGIDLGDKILKVEGKDIKNFDDVRQTIKEKKGESVTLLLSDVEGKNLREVTLTPKSVENDDFKIGVGFSPIGTKKYKTSNEKLFSGITYSYDLTKLTMFGFKKTISDLISGNINSVSKSVAGPVGLATMSNDILSSGPGALPFYLWFVGVISLTLAIFNVLPIPALDGGRLLFLVIEAVIGKKVKEEVERWVHQIGFIILLGLAVLVTYSDISKILHR